MAAFCPPCGVSGTITGNRAAERDAAKGITMSSATRDRGEPAITIDAALVDQLQGLAFSALNRMPALADRLLGEIDRARILPASRLPKTVVTLGSEVTFKDDATGKVQTVVLVLPPEADIGKRRVSVLTPIGVALLGLREGASISWDTRADERRNLTVVCVRAPDLEPAQGTATE
jgi:regulator of nucleoside diphosphate kinase